MQEFTGIEYTKIGIANAFGLDKLTYEERLDWVNSHTMDQLKGMVDDADEQPIFLAACMALEKAYKKQPSGFLLEFDACSSGIQILGALTGCERTCTETGLILPDVRCDFYTSCTDHMNVALKNKNIMVTPDRADVKQAAMTHFYGSVAKPEEIFGEDTVELEQFYETLRELAPGASLAMEDLLNAWQPYAPVHSWVLPDGFEVVVPNMVEKQFKVEVDELDHATFTHQVSVNEGTERGVSVAANATHSVDGMVVREVNRRCNYDPLQITIAVEKLKQWFPSSQLGYNTSKFVSARLLAQIANQMIKPEEIADISGILLELGEQILAYRSFPIVCIHDAFKCHPNNMNQLRRHYIQIMRQLAGSDLLEDILSQIHGTNFKFYKLGDVTNLINGNYAIS
ncbi:DNA-directed RNA polymerase [Marisediminitalea sp.]|uniref:DNA-directed RNA polymerase n=1 Tax=Marisediminitalea sp. TaxID=2662268 RepID=UPI00351597F3